MRKLILLFTFFVLLIATSAHCDQKQLFPTSEFKLGYEGMYMYYDEPNVMHEKGILNGGFGSWTSYFTKYNIMVNIEAEGVAGSLNYTGQYSDGTSLKCDTDDYFISTRANIGKGFDLGNIGLTPYTGIGGRYWNDKIKTSGGYEREITQLYMPLGLNVIAKMDDNWSIGGTFEGDLFLGGEVKSKLSQAGTEYSDAKNTQEFMNGGGGRVSMFMEYGFNSYSVGIEPYFRYWQFAKSETDSVRYGGSMANVVEPKNKFYMSGLRVYLKF